MISVTHQVPRDDVFLGVVRAEPIRNDAYPPNFDDRLRDVIERRARALSAGEERRRSAARDMLRSGTYKPTGRGKPASEYLLRVASRDRESFPRINAPVDVCNYLSLMYVLPISLWDLDRAESRAFLFRLGRTGEAFAFNDAGQMIEVEDLLVGCRVRDDDDPTQRPIVNPIKDSALTKTTSSTQRVAACIYAPKAAVSRSDVASMCATFADLLGACGRGVNTAFHVLGPGQTMDV